MIQVKINKIFKLSATLASFLLLSACYVPPSDEALIERFHEDAALLDELQERYCSLADDPRMRFIAIFSRSGANDRIIGWEEYEKEFQTDAEKQQVIRSLYEVMENLDAKGLAIFRVTADTEHVSNHSCHLQVSVWQMGFITNLMRTGFEYNPPNEHIVSDLNERPERKGSEDVLYRYKLRDDDEDFWYFFYEKI